MTFVINEGVFDKGWNTDEEFDNDTVDELGEEIRELRVIVLRLEAENEGMKALQSENKELKERLQEISDIISTRLEIKIDNV